MSSLKSSTGGRGQKVVLGYNEVANVGTATGQIHVYDKVDNTFTMSGNVAEGSLKATFSNRDVTPTHYTFQDAYYVTKELAPIVGTNVDGAKDTAYPSVLPSNMMVFINVSLVVAGQVRITVMPGVARVTGDIVEDVAGFTLVPHEIIPMPAPSGGFTLSALIWNAEPLLLAFGTLPADIIIPAGQVGSQTTVTI